MKLFSRCLHHGPTGMKLFSLSHHHLSDQETAQIFHVELLPGSQTSYLASHALDLSAVGSRIAKRGGEMIVATLDREPFPFY